jgi:hypothetical protein
MLGDVGRGLMPAAVDHTISRTLAASARPKVIGAASQQGWQWWERFDLCFDSSSLESVSNLKGCRGEYLMSECAIIPRL